MLIVLGHITGFKLRGTPVLIRKRDGRLEDFDHIKIKRAMVMAFEATREPLVDFTPLINAISRCLFMEGEESVVGVEQVQDCVQNQLMESGFHAVAARYILYRDQRARARAERLKPDNKILTDYIVATKYSKEKPTSGGLESYAEICERNKQMHITKYALTCKDLRALDKSYDLVKQKFVLPSMRSMQFGGFAILRNNCRMYNCAFTLVNRPRAFDEIFYLLLCGCGVGFSVQWRHVNCLDSVCVINHKKVIAHSIEDSIEGWADAVRVLINSYLCEDSIEYGCYIEYDYTQIILNHPEGAQLVISGGKAPGHLPLKRLLEKLRSFLDNIGDRSLRPIECYDIICYIAQAVLSGGIRRSSLLCLFSVGDTEMMYAKARGNYNPMTGLNAQRAMANNSAALLRDEDNDLFQIVNIARANFGCPGFLFVSDLDHGINPCGEIGLDPVFEDLGTGFAFCNLTTVNIAACKTDLDFYAACEASAFIGTLQAGYTDFPHLDPVSSEIAKRDALLGVGLDGIMDNPTLSFDQKVISTGVEIIKTVNETWSKHIGINTARSLTTVKPSGTASLLLGCIGSGIHPHHAKRYFRRVTANRNEPQVQYLASINPHMVSKMTERDLSIIFCVEPPPNAICLKDMTACEFIQKVLWIQKHWVLAGQNRNMFGPTHNVSCSVTLHEDEYDDVIKLIKENQEFIAAMSFVSHTIDKDFPFAPREAVTTEADEALWNSLIRNQRPVDWSQYKGEGADLKQSPACDSEKCMI